MSWWVVIAMVNTLTKYVNKVFVQLQSDDLLVCQQKIILEKLAIDICVHTHVEGPRIEGSHGERPPLEDMIVVAQGPDSIVGQFSISHESVIDIIYDQGLFIQEIYDN